MPRLWKANRIGLAVGLFGYLVLAAFAALALGMSSSSRNNLEAGEVRTALIFKPSSAVANGAQLGAGADFGPPRCRLSCMSIERAWRNSVSCTRCDRGASFNSRSKVRAMLGGAPDLGTFDDVAAISHYLGDVRVTYEVFLSLHKRHPELARSCASIAMPALINNGDFKLARAFITDPELTFGAGAAI